MTWNCALAAEFLSSLLAFAGASLLAYDALMAPTRQRTIQGAKNLLDLLKEMDKQGFVTISGQEIRSEQEFAIWMASMTRTRAKLGFVLLSVGFFLDLVTKIP